MKYFFGLAFFFSVLVTPAFAYEVYTTAPTEPYEIIPFAEALDVKQVYLGQLEDFPVMYESVLTSTTTLTVQVSQRYQSGAKPLGLALMIVQADDKDGGVAEVARLHPSAEDWNVRKDSVYGMTFWDSEFVTKELGPGTYRIEVGTPDNIGAYLLTVGEFDDWVGYFETLSRVRTVQENFGYSVFGMLRSSYVYYPLGIVLLLFVIHRTWKFRKYIAHAA